MEKFNYRAFTKSDATKQLGRARLSDVSQESRVEQLDAKELDAWLGRTSTVQDEITAFPMNALAATLDRDIDILMDAGLGQRHFQPGHGTPGDA